LSAIVPDEVVGTTLLRGDRRLDGGGSRSADDPPLALMGAGRYCGRFAVSRVVPVVEAAASLRALADTRRSAGGRAPGGAPGPRGNEERRLIVRGAATRYVAAADLEYGRLSFRRRLLPVARQAGVSVDLTSD
jgi:hypothetical protein